jgi:hypothetical protein
LPKREFVSALAEGERTGLAVFSAVTASSLPFLNTYRTMCLSPDVAFLEVIEQVGALRIAA